MTSWRKLMVLYNRSPGDDAGLERAMILARRHKAELILAETVPSGTGADPRLLDAQRLHLRRFAAGLRHEGIAATSLVLHGDAATQVVREINRRQIDLLLVSPERGSGWWPFAAEDPARALVRECPCPVWVAARSPKPNLGRILATLSLEDTSVARARDIDVLRRAAALARREGAVLDVLHAWDFTAEERDTSRSCITPAILQGLERQRVAVDEARIHRLLHDAAVTLVPVTLHLPRGNPAEEIRRFIKAHSIDLAVVGLGRRSPIAALWSAGMAEDLMADGACEVLGVKAEDFVSAIEDDIVYARAEDRPSSAA